MFSLIARWNPITELPPDRLWPSCDASGCPSVPELRANKIASYLFRNASINMGLSLIHDLMFVIMKVSVFAFHVCISVPTSFTGMSRDTAGH